MELEIGDRVHYIPFKDCDKSLYENGILKSFNEMDKKFAFVVYNCGSCWENYQNYTGASTRLTELRFGWIKKTTKNITTNENID